MLNEKNDELVIQMMERIALALEDMQFMTPYERRMTETDQDIATAISYTLKRIADILDRMDKRFADPNEKERKADRNKG